MLGDSNDIHSLNLQPHTPRFCTFSLAFSACDRHIIGGCSDGCLYVYDRHNNERTLRVPVAFNGRGIHEEKTDVNTVGFLDETSNIIYTGLDNGAIRVSCLIVALFIGKSVALAIIEIVVLSISSIIFISPPLHVSCSVLMIHLYVQI